MKTFNALIFILPVISLAAQATEYACTITNVTDPDIGRHPIYKVDADSMVEAESTAEAYAQEKFSVDRARASCEAI